MNSVLNPEAPEFHPLLTNVVQEGFLTIKKTVKAANKLPVGDSYKAFKIFTGFNKVTHRLSENVLIQANQIMASENPAAKFERNDDEGNTDSLKDLNDVLLDRVEVNMDTLSGVNEPNEEFLKASPKLAAWNEKPTITRITFGTAMLTGAKNIVRPQLSFKDKIDNSDSLWVPKISDKPNSIRPLELKIEYNEKGIAVGYEHPYLVEINSYKPPPEFMEPDKEPYSFPAPLKETPLTLVDTEEKLDELIKHLDGVTEFAVDVEHHSYRTYQGLTCLIQITTQEGGDFVLDALKLREHIHKLNVAFTDPKKLKVFHGGENDVKWLQRDFGVYVVGMFDTYEAAKQLQISPLSLKHLLWKYCNVDTDKKFQTADWRVRPLSADLIQYARVDTHYLIYIWRQMKRDLLELKEQYCNPLSEVFEYSKLVCMQTYNKERVTEDSHYHVYYRSTLNFNNQQMAALKMLYRWRDAHARDMDESPAFLIPNQMLCRLSEELPREIQRINAICHPMPPFIKTNMLDLHRMILACRELPNDMDLFVNQYSSTPFIMTCRRQNVFEQEEELDDLQALDEHLGDIEEYGGGHVFSFDPSNVTASPSATMVPCFLNPQQNQSSQGSPSHILPFERLRYKRLAKQAKELDQIKKCEERIKKISKGNEMINNVLLAKLEEKKFHLEHSVPSEAPRRVASPEAPRYAPYSYLPLIGTEQDDCPTGDEDNQEDETRYSFECYSHFSSESNTKFSLPESSDAIITVSENSSGTVTLPQDSVATITLPEECSASVTAPEAAFGAIPPPELSQPITLPDVVGDSKNPPPAPEFGATTTIPEGKSNTLPEEPGTTTQPAAKKKASRRKRKIQEKSEQKSLEQGTEKKKDPKSAETESKDSIYKTANYKKYFEAAGSSKKNKMKMKKN